MKENYNFLRKVNIKESKYFFIIINSHQITKKKAISKSYIQILEITT